MGLFNKFSTQDDQTVASEEAVVDDSDMQSEGKKFPVIALKNTVIYPYTVVPVFFEDEASLAALEKARKSGGMIAAFTLKEHKRKEAASILNEDPTLIDSNMSEDDAQSKDQAAADSSELQPSDVYGIGTVCAIHRVMPVSGRKGAMVVLQGNEKVQVESMWREKKFMHAVVSPVIEESRDNKEIKALMKNALNSAQKIIQNTPYLPQELQIALEDLSDPLKFVYLLATLVRFDASEKQMILEESDVEEKLKKTAAILSRELEQIELGGKIVSNVKKEFGKMSREAFLRQQLKEIQRELGEESETEREANEYRKKLEDAGFDEDAYKEVSREIDRLESMHPQSSEYQVVRTYLDWVFDIPWTIEDRKEAKIDDVEKVLDAKHYGLKEAKDRIIEYLAVRKLNKSHKGPILCFVGPPGVGKTSLGMAIAESLGRGFVRMSLGGVRDEAEIRGHRRTYVGAMPGRIMQGIRRAGKKDPIFMLDEIDKVGNDYRGDPSSALLEVLDPEQNSKFRDHYLDLEYDLSGVLFICTANVLDTIQGPLRDRMEIIEISGYTEQEKIKIAEEHLWPRVLERHGLTKTLVKLKDEVLPLIIDGYTREAGVRQLERELSTIARKSAYLFVRGDQKSISIGKDRVKEFLGPKKVYKEVSRRTAVPGVVTGLAYTSVGGDILFIEASKMPGSKKFSVTGSLGDVMKESAHTALSLVRSRAEDFNIDNNAFKHTDIHLHVPAGAIPKDGPSAGIAMTTAIASLLMGKKVKNDLAMTGEITLSGLVLPIGGVKEKVLAAKRAGIKTVILPDRNKNDVEKLEKEQVDGLDFVYVETIDQVLKEALQ